MTCEVLPVVVNGKAPGVLPACPLPGQARDGRPLYVLTRPIRYHTRFGVVTVPRGYVTDCASVPRVAAWRIGPLDKHAWAAVLHDWLYAIGEPGKKEMADTAFEDQMRADGVFSLRRELMHSAVVVGGGGGYKKAPTWWKTENFADPETGERVAPPFKREAAFVGQPFGMIAA
ncbi:DUF1353 domain-containing protein [Phenylobacterium deserti]|uniref:DUF1353 domain-containing protein n=1 Tax=Phenylobacterium deserti TaxID=1914756 RepID=A0A328AH13_9CAUL|nr:DUF1353 domain-containing protein [Phenylobacterium deserti]RAK52148.1 hypothetical protein DJ018_13410 [Phenylobacterium deserti]